MRSWKYAAAVLVMVAAAVLALAVPLGCQGQDGGTAYRDAVAQLQHQVQSTEAVMQGARATLDDLGAELPKLEAAAQELPEDDPVRAQLQRALEAAAARRAEAEKVLEQGERYRQALANALTTAGELITPQGELNPAAVQAAGAAAAAAAPAAWVPYIGLGTVALTSVAGLVGSIRRNMQLRRDAASIVASIEQARAEHHELNAALGSDVVKATLRKYQSAGAGALVQSVKRGAV